MLIILKKYLMSECISFISELKKIVFDCCVGFIFDFFDVVKLEVRCIIFFYFVMII